MKTANDIVLSSRIRLARNIKDLPFPHKLQGEVAFTLMKKVSEVVGGLGNFNMSLMSQMTNAKKQSLVERHLISTDLMSSQRMGAVLINEKEDISIMINEEDHLREQAIVEGFGLSEAYEKIRQVDDKLISLLPIAYDSRLGFLTSCPTNLGTGMRASVMLFLPALTLLGKVPAMISTLKQNKIVVRGIYGEGSSSNGCLYQISNQVSLGVSEEEIISAVTKAVTALCELEEKHRKAMFEKDIDGWSDRVCRAKGILTNAHMLSTEEFFHLYTDMKIGIALGVIPCRDLKKVNNLLVQIQPANLTLGAGRNLLARERDIFRAQIVKQTLAQAL